MSKISKNKGSFDKMFKEGDYIEHSWKGTEHSKRERILEVRRGFIEYFERITNKTETEEYWVFSSIDDGNKYILRYRDVGEGLVKYFPPEDYPEYYI